MHQKPKKIIPVIIIAVLVVAVGGYLLLQNWVKSDDLVYSGTIEAIETNLGSQVGGRVERVAVTEGEGIEKGVVVVEVRPNAGTKEIIRSPIDGVVLTRSVEPGEIAAPGTPLITVANLDDLTLTVYVPEDRYGLVMLGHTYPVTVDSFPELAFDATVSHIADHAEFTPRNVQTTDSRKTTVFAIKLTLAPSGGKLKPGMPADVHFE